MKCFFSLSGEDEMLAKAECKALHECARWEEFPFVLVGDVKELISDRLAFTKVVFEVFARGSFAALSAWCKDNPRPVSSSVKFFKKSFSGESLCSQEVFSLLSSWLGNPTVDLDAPDELFGLLVADDEWFLVREAWVNEENFVARKSHNKPAPHPTGMHPKLARAMVNLAVPKKEVCDPFCGAGGILLEAGLMGFSSVGVDIDARMIARAKINLEAFSVTAKLHASDCLLFDEQVECMVTDAPYGKNSVASDLEPLFTAFLSHASKLTNTLIIGFPDFTDNKKMIAGSSWVCEESFVWSLHKTLKKEIFVLKK